MAARHVVGVLLAWGLSAGQALGQPSPSPLPIRAISVDVVPIHAGPGLSVSAPRADRIELPAGARRFRILRPAPAASPSSTSREGCR